MTTAVIVAAGRSSRMGAGIDKLFLTIAGKPLVEHTWKRFDECPDIDEIVLVIQTGKEESFAKLAAAAPRKKPFRLAPGGAERQDSVWNGLAAVRPETEIVVIQDAARPCTDPDLIGATIRAARETGAAVAAQRVTDTIKESDGNGLIQRTIDRTRLWAVQTPQTFQLEVIRRALAAVRKAGAVVTDDTAACELIGQPVRLVEGGKPNPKATNSKDLPVIEALLREMKLEGAGTRP